MVIDRFRVRPDHDMWCGVSVARSHMIVFARRAVEIEQAARRRLVASPVIATLYNRGQEYRRTPIEDEDLNEAFHFAPGLVRDAIAAFDPSVLDREDVFAHGSFPVSASTYLLQRRVVLYAARGPHADPLRVEEGALQVLERSLADAVELSPFHLCRVFRAHVGMTIGEFVHRERLRRSLGELERASIDLTEVALKYGYASHSHFTSRFGREFNATPSTIRRALSRGGLPADAIL
jgi:AraC-like DNA-binding protein